MKDMTNVNIHESHHVASYILNNITAEGISFFTYCSQVKMLKVSFTLFLVVNTVGRTKADLVEWFP